MWWLSKKKSLAINDDNIESVGISILSKATGGTSGKIAEILSTTVPLNSG